MKSGTTFMLIANIDIDISKVSEVVFTLQGKTKVTKTYPNDVSYSNKEFLIPLNQKDTSDLAGSDGAKVKIEAQINFNDKSVLKSEICKIYIGETLATKTVTGNAPSAYDTKDITIDVVDNVIIAKVNPAELQNAIDEAKEELDEKYATDLGGCRFAVNSDNRLVVTY